MESIKERKEFYDAIQGKPIREILNNDLYVASASTGSIATAGTATDLVLFNQVCPTGYEWYPYIWNVTAGTPTMAALVVNGSTQHYNQLIAQGQNTWVEDHYSPITKVAAFSTLSVVFIAPLSAASTYTTSFTAKRVPTYPFVETDR